MKTLFFLALSLLTNFISWPSAYAQVTDGFVDVTTLAPSLKVEARYFSHWNFMGRPVEGYEANKCYLTKEAATALSEVQKDMLDQGYSLLAFDCYRPQRAVNDFVKWSKDPSDLKMQKIFYRSEPKATLFQRGYIAEKSGHSRGSTIDLTVVNLVRGQFTPKSDRLLFQEEAKDCRHQKNISKTHQLDMGTTFDCFSTMAYTANKDVSKTAQKNRQILKSAMEKHGFENYSKEWWHYTLKNEPHPDQYFDFVVK